VDDVSRDKLGNRRILDTAMLDEAVDRALTGRVTLGHPIYVIVFTIDNFSSEEDPLRFPGSKPTDS